MKRNVLWALMSLLVAFALAAPAAYAQSYMDATVPFAFNIGQKAMPAGHYEVRWIADQATLIQCKDSDAKVLQLSHQVSGNGNSTPKLVFQKSGDRYFLRQIWSRRDNGLELPTTQLEKELRASGNTPSSEEATFIVALR